MSLRTLMATVPLSDGSPFTGTLRVEPLEEIYVDGMNVAVKPVDYAVTAGALPTTAKIVAPGRYSFTLLDGADELQCFQAVVPDGTAPVSLFDLKAGTGAPDPPSGALVLVAGSSVLLLVPGGGADGQYLVRVNATTLAWSAAPGATWGAIAGKPATFPPDAHVHAVATATAAGFMGSDDRVKLDGIAPGATVNAADEWLLDRENHTGTQRIETIDGIGDAAALNVGTGTGTVAAGDHLHGVASTTAPGYMAASDKGKLNGIAPGATANADDEWLLDRENHTGTQRIETIDGIGDAASLNVGTAAGTVAAGDHTHATASTIAAGFMSAADKAKLDGIPVGGAVLPAPIPYVFSTKAIGFNITNLHVSAAPLEFNNSAGTGEGRMLIDLTKATSLRLNLSVVSTTQPAGCVVTAQYSTDGGSTWSYFSTTGLNAPIDLIGQKVTAWAAVPVLARADVQVRIVGYGGGSGSSATVSMVKLDVR